MMEWLPLGMLLVLYAICFATIGVRTFANGHPWLGVCGAVVPILWVLGVVLPARPRAAVRRRHVVNPPRHDRASSRRTVLTDESWAGLLKGRGGRRTTSWPEQDQPAAVGYRGPDSQRPVRHQQAVRVTRPIIGRPLRGSHGGPATFAQTKRSTCTSK
jgi:hypothetical protein